VAVLDGVRAVRDGWRSSARDLFLFYLFWEACWSLFLIIESGAASGGYATLKFVLYTAFGSILMLAAVISCTRSKRRQ
jgi:NADH-quinone oxidoreductase subunit M